MTSRLLRYLLFVILDTVLVLSLGFLSAFSHGWMTWGLLAAVLLNLWCLYRWLRLAFAQAALIDRWSEAQDELTARIVEAIEQMSYRQRRVRRDNPIRKRYDNDGNKI